MQHALAARPSQWDIKHLQDMFRLGDMIRNPHAMTLCAGVLVYDLEKWRSEQFTDALEALTPLTGTFLFDNTPLALVFQDKYDNLDWRWHVPHLGWAHVNRRCFNQARVLHWNGPKKYLGRNGRY